MDNPWREFIENCIKGDNYFRASEYRELLADLDRGYAAEARLAESDDRAARLAVWLEESEARLAEYESVFGHLGMTPDELGNHFIGQGDRLAEAEYAIESAGKCLVMSNNGPREALEILRRYKATAVSASGGVSHD